MENANDWKKEIGIALEGWDIRTVQVDEVGYFEATRPITTRSLLTSS
jgi:hypothetical protein